MSVVDSVPRRRWRTMTRWIAAAACALTLGLALPLGNVAEADGFRRAAPVYSKKRCIAPEMRFLWRAQTQVTWVCAAAERCCYDRLLRRGTCIAADARCF
jgi:hypothetical protein